MFLKLFFGTFYTLQIYKEDVNFDNIIDTML